MKALAYYHGPDRILNLAKAFQSGCKRHGIDCDLRSADRFKGPEPVDVVWMYGLGPAMPVFSAYEGRRRVIGDVGYWRELLPPLPKHKRYVRISIDSQQPDKHLRLREHPPDRFNALGLQYLPVDQRGDHILVSGYSPRQAGKFGTVYGAWEADTVLKLKSFTNRPIVVREKPRNPPFDIPGTARCLDADCWKAIRKAWAVVCRSGNIGADCLLHGVPVFAEMGPGYVYGNRDLSQIDNAQSVSHETRMRALSDLAYWQWSQEEIAQGLLWESLKLEGVI